MENEFKCYNCSSTFKAEGRKKEYKDPIFGPCVKLTSICPSCGTEAGELVKPKFTGTKKMDTPCSGNCCQCP